MSPPTSPPTSSPPAPQPPTSSPSIPQPSTSPPTSSPPTSQQPTSPPPTAQPPPTSPSPTVQPPTSSPTSPPPSPDAGQKLRVGYYIGKCARYVDVEAIVRKHVSQADAGIKAGLIRLFFHDCFVRGCGASVLLDPTTANPQPEKLGVPNFPSLRGFEVIDAAKAELEAACPGTVSCADIVAFAARDASSLLSRDRVGFAVPAGRYDGTVSLAGETIPNLPPPFADAARLERMFAAKGLDAADMVALSGAHSVGRSHCSSFSGRLAPPGSNASGSDMDPVLAARLKAACAASANNNSTDGTVAQDYRTPDELDSQYYRNVLDRKVLFASDAALNAAGTASLVRFFANVPWAWQFRFGEAMVKMGRVEVKTAANGEIRKACRLVNSKAGSREHGMPASSSNFAIIL
ncbi:peroxidase 2-like [Panicum miliaceum]|uniref:Peroxidase n=1 Tax=Panicum miliaceum TaxID=4540 RepID=A0A3L6RJ87_PANMI|nr:peroxidase 2-like [Panicum miliaceum]